MVVDGGKEGGILIQKIAKQKGVGVAYGFPGEILDWVEGLTWGGKILGEFFFRMWVTGEEVGCYFRRTGSGGLRNELAVLCVEESAEAWEILWW